MLFSFSPSTPLSSPPLGLIPLSVYALWRGHQSRKLHDNRKVVSMRHRLRKVSEEVREEDRLCNKTSWAIEYLLKYKQFSYILEALKNLGETALIPLH